MPEQSYNRPRLTGLTPRQAMAVAGIRRDGEGRFSIDPIVYNIDPYASWYDFSAIDFRGPMKLTGPAKTRSGFFAYRTKNRDQLIRKLAYYGNLCRYCRTPLIEGVNLVWDHAIPVSRGGKNMLANLLPSCVHCNSRKRAKTFFEFLRLV